MIAEATHRIEISQRVASFKPYDCICGYPEKIYPDPSGHDLKCPHCLAWHSAQVEVRARANGKAHGYAIGSLAPAALLEPRGTEQSVADYNATNLLKIYGGHDPEAALIILKQLARSLGVPPDSIDRFLAAGYVPQPKQLAFHAAARSADHLTGPTRIATGGSRGGGKTVAVLAQVVIDDCQRHPDLKWLFLRKVLKSARESFEDLRRTTLMGVEHEYKSSRNLLELPNGSRVILGHYGTEKDIDAYLGLEYDGAAIEEATQLSEGKIKDIGSCIRTSKPNWRPREYDTANPGGVSHGSFKREFIEPARKGTETTTRFIPSGHDDNVFLNPDYIFNLSRLTGWKEKAWKEGDWDIAAGQFFSTWNYNAIVKKNLTIMPGSPVWASLDYGFQHPTVAYLFSSYDGKIRVIDEHWRQKALVSENADDIKAMLDRHGIDIAQLKVFYAGHDVFASRGNESGKTIATEYTDNGIKLTKAYIDRINGAGTVLKLLGSPARGIDPLVEISERCVRLIECLPAMQHDEDRPEDVLKVNIDEDGTGGDDPYDGFRYGVAQKPKKGRVWVSV